MTVLDREERRVALPDLSGLEPFAGRKRWTRAECAFLERLDALPERYELIDGEVIDKVGQNRPHAVALMLLIKWLIAIFGGDFVQCQLPVEVAPDDREHNDPEPDAAVLTQPGTAYMEMTPGPGDLRLIVEVADTTLRTDLRTKADLYARAGVPEYWVLDVRGRRLFAHRDPRNGAYAEVRTYTETDELAPLAAPDRPARIADLLPPAAATAVTEGMA